MNQSPLKRIQSTPLALASAQVGAPANDNWRPLSANDNNGNGVTDARTFDLDYRLTSITDHGTSNIQYVSYGYDADNNVHTFTDNVTPANNKTLTYDAIDRLINEGGAISNTVPAGSDLMSKSNGGNYTYDSAGNLTSVAGGATQAYSKANRLASVNSNNTYAYDAFGLRLKAKAPGTPFQTFAYDLNGHLLEETNSGVETDYVYLDNMPLSTVKTSTAAFYALHTDRLGAVRGATDSTKTVQWACNYATFGACVPSPANIIMNLRLAGMYSDPTGFYYNIYRMYYPGDNNGRYTQPDFLGLLGPTTPDSNPFTYARANTWTYADPTGTFAIPAIPAGADFLGGLIGGSTGWFGGNWLWNKAFGGNTPGTASGQGVNSSVAKTDCPTCDQCRQLQAQIKAVADEIKERQNKMLMDPSDLFLNAYDQPLLGKRKGSYVGHYQAMNNAKTNLSTLITQADSMNPPCLVDPSDRAALSLETPEHPADSDNDIP